MRVASLHQDEALTVRELVAMLAVAANTYFPSLFVKVTAPEPVFILPETLKLPSEDAANDDDVVEPPQVAFLATTLTGPEGEESTPLEVMRIDVEENERDPLVALMEPEAVRLFSAIRVWVGEVMVPLTSISLTFVRMSFEAVIVIPCATTT